MAVFEFHSDGLRLVGERWGEDEPNGVVVLLHGGGQTRHAWGRTAERLVHDGWSSIAVDLRGHGESDWDPGRDYTLDAFVADLMVLLRTLDRTPVLVGASLGGMTSLVAAGEHPGLARALVLVDVVPQLEPAGVTRIQAFLRAHRNGFATLDDVADAISAYNPERRRTRNLEGLKKNVRIKPDGRWYWHWDPEFIKIGDEPRRQAEPLRLRAAAERLTIPTLLVRGAQSDIVSEAGIEDMRRLVPNAEYVTVGAAGHMVAGDDNDVFAGYLTAFLAGLDPE